MKQIEFTHSGASSVLGAFSQGDIANVDDEHADHLVNEACVAKFVGAAKAQEPKQETKPGKGKGK